MLLHGDCLEVLRTLPDNSVDSIVTDPPYGLSFMGRKWDYDVPSEDIWRECLRVLKPGGHLLAFAGTRTQHRMAVRIEDAGFEIRDMIAWIYGSGFPKSLDVSKAIDKMAGAEREIVGEKGLNKYNPIGMENTVTYRSQNFEKANQLTAPATEAAKQWEGWGTALKPALEPITVARKPLIGTVAENVLEWGTGGINVDGCRVVVDSFDSNHRLPSTGNAGRNSMFGVGGHKGNLQSSGRWPANLIHDGSDEVVAGFPVTGVSRGGNSKEINSGTGKYNWNTGNNRDQSDGVDPGYGDSGSAARFFYCAKASKRDRDEGCEGLPLGEAPASARSKPAEGRENALGQPRSNHHPTVKPTELMRYLCRLVTPTGGIVLDPFMGSGSTGKAAILEGFDFIGIEREAEYMEIAKARIDYVSKQPKQGELDLD